MSSTTECLTWGVPNARWTDKSNPQQQTATWPRGFLLRYDLDEVIGHGASSEVFAARIKGSGESVAVKRVFKRRCCVGARATRRLRDEVRVLSSLKHPNVIDMREVWETPTELYIVMERAHGGELFDRIVDRGNFSEAQAKTVMRQLLSALSEMHRRGVIHRDVKPENLLLTTKQGWDIKLSDFGLVKTLEDDDEIPSFAVVSESVSSSSLISEEAAEPPTQQQPPMSPSVSPGDATIHYCSRKRRPSWGEALEPVDEQRPQQYIHSHELSEGGGTAQRVVAQLAVAPTTIPEEEPPRAVNYYYSTAGVDVQLNGGPFHAEVDGKQEPSDDVEDVTVVEEGQPTQKRKKNQREKRSVPLSEEEAFALLPALENSNHPMASARTMTNNERDVAALFRRARTHTLCGSPYYMAPEVCDRERYGPAVDLWSAGVVMYILLTGSPPWDRPPQFRAPPPLDMHELSQVSRVGVDLLLKMLKAIPEERCTAAEALRHPWLREELPLSVVPGTEDEGECRGLSPRFDSAIRNFCEKRKRHNTSLDMTPVARALADEPRWAQSPTIVKRNRRASPPTVPRYKHHSHVPNEYDTFSSDGDDDDDDDAQDDDDDEDVIPNPPDIADQFHPDLFHDPFRLSLDAVEPVVPIQKAATW